MFTRMGRMDNLTTSCLQPQLSPAQSHKNFSEVHCCDSVPNHHRLTQAQTQTLSINVLFFSPFLHPSYNNMHKQIQSEPKSLPEHCPPYGPRKKKKLTFNCHSSTFISIHEYANPTVPVAITMRAPTGRCQHCQGRKANTLPVAGTECVCVCVCVCARKCACEPQTDAPVYLWPVRLLSQSTGNKTSPTASSVHTHTNTHTHTHLHLCPLSYTHQWDAGALKDLWTTLTDLKATKWDAK